MDVIEKVEEFINKQTDKVKQRVRNKAIKQAETQMIVAGKKLDELSLEDWEHVVAEQEKEVWDKYTKGGLWTVIGLAFWLP
jgi:hypothetical protein